MISISSKELRTNFKLFITKVKEGESFLLIHNSEPVAEIKKTVSLRPFSETSKEATQTEIENSAIYDSSEDFLNKEELDYYLALK
jgi:antitoxin (DNA-binding transcriptional repressor) of toxin-antitoxin stability system